MRFRRHGDSANILLDVGEERQIYSASSSSPISLEIILPEYTSAIFTFNPKEPVFYERVNKIRQVNIKFHSQIKIILY